MHVLVKYNFADRDVDLHVVSPKLQNHNSARHISHGDVDVSVLGEYVEEGPPEESD